MAQETGVTELIEKVVSIKRVTKVTKGGKNFKLSVWAVVGDGNGTVGIGHGKAQETPEAIQKALKKARKAMVKVVVLDGTLPHEIVGKQGASRVLLKPAGPGTGIIASQPVRLVLEAAGYQNALTKALSSTSAVNIMKATMNGIKRLRDPEEIAKNRGISSRVIYRRFKNGEKEDSDKANTKSD